MTNKPTAKPVLICDSQPIAIEGLRWLLTTSEDLRFSGGVCNLDACFELARTMVPSAVVLDKSLGFSAVMEWLRRLSASGVVTAPVVWGTEITESEALKLLQAGARGILRRTTEPDRLIACLRTVIGGTTWMEEGIFGETEKPMQPRRSNLTPREQQIATLVEQGLRNRDIGRMLGIQTGTVKIHLKHIFEKTGVRGRYSLALISLREKGALALPTM
jgi:two-component system nitrate/nitrite response regulator NarL